MGLFAIFLFILGVTALAWLAFKKHDFAHFPSIDLSSIPTAPKRPKKPSAPITGVCSECGKEVTLPFKCKYCNKLFCGEHRLPESHSCPAV